MWQPDPATQALLAELPARISHVIRRHEPATPALTDGATTWTYADLNRITDELAVSLGTYGVRPGDRLLIVGENSLALAALVLAASEINAWAVVANPRLSSRELDQIRDHSGARLACYVTGVSAGARQHAIRHGAADVALGALGTIAVGLNEAAVAEPVEADSAKQVAALMYTSGTTGKPKGVMLTHRNLLFNARVSGILRHVTPADRLYGVLPMSHIVGLSNILVSGLMHGASIQVAPRYDPAELARAIAEDGVTMLYGVPATYQRLLEYQTVQGLGPLSRGRLRYIGVAGAPLDPALKRRVEAELGLNLLNGYGITECAPGISAVRPEAPSAGTDVGRPIPGIELRVVDRAGNPVPPDAVGELHVRGPGVMRGYYRAPELTATTIDAEGWFNTGDLVRFDGACLAVVGRTKELIIRSGFNVYPPEVEAVLSTHPDVVQAAVVGRAVGGNEEVVAYVSLLQGATTTAAALMQHASAQLTAYKRPSEIIILPSLPASSTGKILKHRLAQTASGQAPE